jgi:FkbM family methyltransferase
MLAWLTKLLEGADTPIGTVLHIGAGVGTELSVYHDLNCEQVLAIEPDSTLFKKLQAKAKRFDNVSVQQAWIADTTAERNANIFSNPRFNSLLPADKLLLEHFPNIKNTKQVKVNTQSFNELVTNNVKRKNERLNVLVLDIQGFETTLFNNGPASILQLFDWIIVRASEEPLFECGAQTSDIKKSLRGPGFELRLTERDQLPFVAQYYQLNTSVIELVTVKSELQILSEQRISEKQDLYKVKQVLASQNVLVEQLEDRLSKYIEEINTSKLSLDKIQKQLNQETERFQQVTQEKVKETETLNAQIVVLTELAQTSEAEVESAAAENKELCQQIVNYNQSEQDKSQLIGKIQSRSDELVVQCDGIKKALEDTRTKFQQEISSHQESAKRVENLNSQIAETRKQSSERQKSGDLAIKLMTKAQIDLDDLRRKYQSKSHNEKKMVDLIRELRQKLQQASQFYFYLQENYPILIDSKDPNQIGLNDIRVQDKDDVGMPKVQRKKKRGGGNHD